MTHVEVVEALARFDPIRVAPIAGSVSVHWNRCVLCGARASYYDPPSVFPHKSGCLWLAAKGLAGD